MRYTFPQVVLQVLNNVRSWLMLYVLIIAVMLLKELRFYITWMSQ